MEFNKENFEICLCEDGSITIDQKEFVKVRNKTTGETKKMPYTDCVEMELIVPTEEKNAAADNGSPAISDPPTVGTRKIISLWGELETKMLHSLYADNQKLFSSKSLLWEFISQEVNEKFGSTFSPFQVECRYNRKKRKLESSKASSTSRNTMAYYRQVNKFMRKDDSSLSGVGQGARKSQKISSESSTSSSDTESSSSSQTSLDAAAATVSEQYLRDRKALFAIKEEERDKRHEEELKIIKSLAETLKKYSEK